VTSLEPGSLETAVGSIELHRGGRGGPAPLVYLHSAQGEGSSMTMLEMLADSRQVLVPVFPGFGESQGLERIDDIEDAAFHLLDVLDRLALAQCDLVGLSLGGWMAAELGVRWPERVRRMVLVNPVGLYVAGSPIAEIFGRSLPDMAGALFADPDHPVAQLMYALGAMEQDPAQIPFEMVRPFLQAQAATAKLGWNPYLHDPKLASRLHRIAAPTLVVHARRDGIVPRAVAEAYVSAIPDAEIADVEDAAHLAPIERPDALSALVLDHLGS
jgi:pimeloyl-ACP methyl ester carboxylesterase